MDPCGGDAPPRNCNCIDRRHWCVAHPSTPRWLMGHIVDRHAGSDVGDPSLRARVRWTGGGIVSFPLRSTRETSMPPPRDIPERSERQYRSVSFSFLFVRSDRDRRACGIMNVRHSTPSMLSSSNDVSRASSRLYSLLLCCPTARSVARLSCLSSYIRVLIIVLTNRTNSFSWGACGGIIDESVLECCARVHLWAWINAHTDCFERMNHAASGLDSLQGDDADTEFN